MPDFEVRHISRFNRVTEQHVLVRSRHELLIFRGVERELPDISSCADEIDRNKFDRSGSRNLADSDIPSPFELLCYRARGCSDHLITLLSCHSYADRSDTAR